MIPKPAARWRLSKRAFDLCISCLLLVVLFPFLVTVAVLVLLDGGPLLFSHRRLGLGGQPFECLKFRTMVPDADALLRRTLNDDPDTAKEWALTRKLRRDPRITSLGRVLRRLSIDELPQLWNVVRGDMSLVGPRPIVSEEIPFYGEQIGYYYTVPPGVTGLWQVSGRSNTTYEHRVELDVWYVKNGTAMLDLLILGRTVSAVIRGNGAR